jgi:D-cysteine desulfhydrase
MALNYPARLPLARLPTPLQPLERIGDQLGIRQRLWVKRDDLTGSALSGNKVRKLEFVTAEAIASGCDTLITCGGLQSNHCRSTALVGARLGLKVHLVLRGEPSGYPDGNLFLDHLAGAAISCYPHDQYVAELESLLEHWANHYAERGHKAHILPTGASDGIGIWGYIAASEELALDLDQAGIAKAHVVTATGSGGTQAGLTLGAALQGLPIQVWGVNVCDDEAWFLNKVAEDVSDWEARYGQSAPELAPAVIDGYVGPGYGRATAEVFDTIALAARCEGLVLDPVYTGKAFHGMLRELASGRFDDCDDVVFLHTGGIYGLFPQRQQFGFHDKI